MDKDRGDIKVYNTQKNLQYIKKFHVGKSYLLVKPV